MGEKSTRKFEIVAGVALVSAIGLAVWDHFDREHQESIPQFVSYQITQGNLRLHAIEACNSLSDDRMDNVIRETTDFNGMQDFLTHRQGTLNGDAHELTIGALNATQNNILKECLHERNAPGDAETLQEISRFGLG